MSTEAWIAVAVVVILVVAVLVAMLTVGPWGQQRRLEGKRKEAGQLRQEAQQHFARAGEQETVAEQAAERARREREQAQESVRRAEDADPDEPKSDAQRARP